MTYKHLVHMWDQRDDHDHREGLRAYERYKLVMGTFAMWYGFPVGEVTSAFVALSPNNDYHGNLRSLASVLDGRANDVPLDRITVSTYNACRDRAYLYLDGQVSFLDTVKGPKIRAFRDNILRPDRSPLVTVDGHMVCAWTGKDMTMKEAARVMTSQTMYRRIASDIVELSVAHDIAPCQAQAVLWFTRKRVKAVKYDAQLSLFHNLDDTHRTLCDPKDYPPYPIKQEK